MRSQSLGLKLGRPVVLDAGTALDARRRATRNVVKGCHGSWDVHVSHALWNEWVCRALHALGVGEHVMHVRV